MKLFGRIEKATLYVLAGLHMAALYAWGICHWPIPTAAVALVWILVTLHLWPPEEKP